MEDQDNGLACQLVFTYTDKYPDTAPLVEIEDPVDFEDDYEPRLLEHIQETVSLASVYEPYHSRLKIVLIWTLDYYCESYSLPF